IILLSVILIFITGNAQSKLFVETGFIPFTQNSFAKDFQLSTLAKPIDSLQLALFIDESMKLPLHAWKGGAAGLVAEDFTKHLHTIESPVLIFWGSKDMICFRRDQEDFVRN